MRKVTGESAWVRHLGVAIAYAVGYSLLKEFTFSHWVVVAGLRLAVLLLVPYRYWAAMAIGEVAALGYTAIPCAQVYGWLWASEFMIPPMLVMMPVVRWFRRHGLVFEGKSATSMSGLLLCTLLVSLLCSLVDLASLATGPIPADQAVDFGAAASRYFLGNYLGILTIVPLALVIREELLVTQVRQFWQRLTESRLAMEGVSLLLPSLALLAWLAVGAHGSNAGQAARVAMFLPVAWLALKHGWKGAALGGTAANVAVVATMPFTHDSGTLQAQVFIAFTITTMLLLGARIAALCSIEQRERTDARMVLAMAQRNVYAGEMQLRQTSYILEQMGQRVRESQDQLLGRLRFLLPNTDERGYHRQATATQQQIYRLADTIYPLNWGEGGLPAALREGSIPRALDEAGLGYWCEITGRGLSQLSPSVHLALYRLACEAIATVCAGRNVGRIDIRLRGGSTGTRRWATLCVDGRVEAARGRNVRWDDLLPTLGQAGMGLTAIQDRAAVFEGTAKERWLAGGRRISIMLLEPEQL